MKNKFLSIFLIISILLIPSSMTLSSCSKVTDDNAEIQLWTYDYGQNNRFDGNYYNASFYSNDLEKLIKNIKVFCEENEIPLKVFAYDSKILSYDDYVLKRNIAVSKGNAIIIEDARYLWDLSDKHADYSKLKNYNKLLDAYKDRFCIPIGIGHTNMIINRSILDYYGIELEKSIITYDEYLQIKQNMKDNDARFYVNYYEFLERINFYKKSYDLLNINNSSEILKDIDKFKAALKSIIIETSDDLVKYNDSKLNMLDLDKQNYSHYIYDEKSKLNMFNQLPNGAFARLTMTSFPSLNERYNYISENNIVVFNPPYTISPSFFMYEKITNDKIYELANFIISEESYKIISERGRAYNIYMPSFKGEITRESLELDENFNYNGIYKIAADSGDERGTILTKLINEFSEILIKDKKTSKLLVDYYFINEDYSDSINEFIAEVIFKLSEKNFNYKDDDVNKWLDEQIGNYTKNFNIHFK